MSWHQGEYGCRGRLRKREKSYAKTELPGEATAGDDKQGSLKAALRQSLATGKSRPKPVGHGHVLARPVSLEQRTLDAMPKTVVRNYLSNSANCARTLSLAVSVAVLL